MLILNQVEVQRLKDKEASMGIPIRKCTSDWCAIKVEMDKFPLTTNRILTNLPQSIVITVSSEE